MTSVLSPLAPASLPRVTADTAIVVGEEARGDVAGREHLLDRAFGPARFAKTCERLRAGRLPAAGLSLVARAPASRDGAAGGSVLVGTVRLWPIDAGGRPALMLGPLAVDDAWRCHRVGARLMGEALARAGASGHRAVLLVGDAPYYARFGFSRRHTLGLRLPGPVEADRFLGLELTPGALAGVEGAVGATGAIDLAARRRPHRAQPRRAA
jgi:predicted N-acetyltransferase YhbS